MNVINTLVFNDMALETIAKRVEALQNLVYDHQTEINRILDETNSSDTEAGAQITGIDYRFDIMAYMLSDINEKLSAIIDDNHKAACALCQDQRTAEHRTA